MKPTTNTVVTDDDCTTAVTPAPVSRPVMRWEVSFSRMRRSRSPATTRKDSVMRSMPRRNSANPPSSPTIRSNQSISAEDSVTTSAVAKSSDVTTSSSRFGAGRLGRPRSLVHSQSSRRVCELGRLIWPFQPYRSTGSRRGCRIRAVRLVGRLRVSFRWQAAGCGVRRGRPGSLPPRPARRRSRWRR